MLQKEFWKKYFLVCFWGKKCKKKWNNNLSRPYLSYIRFLSNLVYRCISSLKCACFINNFRKIYFCVFWGKKCKILGKNLVRTISLTLFVRFLSNLVNRCISSLKCARVINNFRKIFIFVFFGQKMQNIGEKPCPDHISYTIGPIFFKFGK